MSMTDEDREEALDARALVKNIIAHVFPHDIIAFNPKVLDIAGRMVLLRDDRIRAEAKAEALAAMAPCIGAYESALKDKAGECTWREGPEGYWSTHCGRSWTFIEGGPKENGIRYCHGCGKPVRIADETKEGE